MTRHRPSGLGVRVTLVFAVVYAAVVALTDLLILFGVQASELERGYARQRSDTRLLARLVAGESLPIVTLRAFEDRFDAYLIIDSDGEMIYEYGFESIRIDPRSLETGKTVIRRHSGEDGPRKIWIAWASTDRQLAVIYTISRLDESYKAVRVFAAELLLVSGLLAVVGFWVMLIAGAGISRPVSILTAAARRVAGGDLTARAGIIRSDELGRLAETFDTMTEQIEKAEESRRGFLTAASHELRTPLASVRALVDALLSDDDDPAERREFLCRINREIDRLTALIRQINTRTRLEDIHPVKSRVELRQSAWRSIELLEAVAREHCASVVNLIPADCVVAADPEMLDNVFLNLLDNAIRHGGKSTKVVVSAEAADSADRTPDAVRGDRCVVLRIANTGPEIPEEAISRLFEPFFTVDPARSRGVSGAGLGLSIVKSIAAAHRWNVSVTSSGGRTEFVIEMSVTRQEA